MSISRKALAYRTGAIYALLFVGLLVYFGLYKKQPPAMIVVGIALLFAGAAAVKVWLLSYVSRQADEPWVEKAVDLGLDVLFFVVFIAIFIGIGRMS